MNNIAPIEIPEEFQKFASQVADLATTNGIEKFTMTFVPSFDRYLEQDRRITGEMKIHFSAVDQRGRPCRSLGIHLSANHILAIESNPESS